MFFLVPWIFVWSKVCKQGFLASFLHLILWVSPSNIKLSMLPGSWKLGGGRSTVSVLRYNYILSMQKDVLVFIGYLSFFFSLSLSLFFLNYIVYQMQYYRFVIFMSYHYFPGRRVEEKRGPRSQICRFGRYKPGLSSVLGISVGSIWNWVRYVRLSEGLKGSEKARYSWFNGLVKTIQAWVQLFANWSEVTFVYGQ